MTDATASTTCTKCGETKPASEFYSPGRRCKACHSARNKAWYEANKARKLAKAEIWRSQNLDRVRASERARYAAQPEKFAEKRRAEVRSGKRAELVAAWRAANPERSAELSRKWRAANRDRLNQQARAAYAADPEALREKARRWRRANREEYRQYMRDRRRAKPEVYAERANARRAQKLGTTLGPIDLKAMWIQQSGLCGICGEPIPPELKFPDPLSRSMDHIVPLSRGGGHVAENMRWAHLFCNMSKGSKLDDEMS